MSENQVITIVTALVPLYPFLFAIAGVLFRWFVARLPADQHALVNQIVQAVVNAVEQSGTDRTSIEKKRIAVRMIEDILQSFHINVSPTLIEALIEAAVYGINQGNAGSLPSLPVNGV